MISQKSAEQVYDPTEVIESVDSDEECDVIEYCTDNEEEVSHDIVVCKICGKESHVSLGKCTHCGAYFNFTASGYIIDAEGDGFICDDDSDVSCDESGTESEEEGEFSDEHESACTVEELECDKLSNILRNPDDEFMLDDEAIKLSVASAPRRVTRSMTK